MDLKINLVMKKIFVFSLLVLSMVFASAQGVTIDIDGLRYTTKAGGKAKVKQIKNKSGVAMILGSITYNGTTYVVDEIEAQGFKNSNLTRVIVPNAITKISASAFYNAKIVSIEIPSSTTSIGASAFANCTKLTSVKVNRTTPTTLGLGVFTNTPVAKQLTVPCGSLDAYKANRSWVASFTNSGVVNIKSDCATYTSVNSGAFNNPATWGLTSMPEIAANFVINEGHRVILNSALRLTSENTLKNDGILEIDANGQLINTTTTEVGGIIEINSTAKQENKWNFMGAPFAAYSLKAIVPTEKDVSVSMFDYTTGNWSEDWAEVNTSVIKGEGYFLWTFGGGKVIYTTYGDGMYSDRASAEYVAYTYDYDETPAYKLNNGDVVVSKPVKAHVGGGNWMALSNPYPAKLNVQKFLAEQSADIQGNCVYQFNGASWDIKENVGEVEMTGGFFLNFETEGSKTVTFKKEHLTNYNSLQTLEFKSEKSNDNIEIALIDGEHRVKMYFAHNELAKANYDRFDADKMFATVNIAEPYFVVDGKKLVKEEVNTLPYTANFNVRAEEGKELSFVVDNLPEGYVVFLIDGEENIRLSEGFVYTTQVSAGENQDRFKLLVRKNRTIEQAEELEAKVLNNNRNIEVVSAEQILTVEVMNNLGQKVYETTQTEFVLSEAPAGVYFVKVSGRKNQAASTSRVISTTAKIVIN